MEQEIIDSQKKEILSDIRRDMNGAVVGVMNDMIHSEPFFSYGVSVVKIKEVAKRYFPNHLLAAALFDTKIRELKLAAIYIDSPAEVTKEQMNGWKDSFFSLELAEHASSMLFYSSDCALDVAYEWIGDDNDFVVKAACLIIGKHAKLCFKDQDKGKYKEIIDKSRDILLQKNSSIVFSALLQCVSSIANSDTDLSEYLKNTILKHASQEIKDDLIWRLNC